MPDALLQLLPYPNLNYTNLIMSLASPAFVRARRAAALLLFSVLGSAAHAVTIVDTGPGVSPGSGPLVYSYQSVAAEFELDQNYLITSVEGWFASGRPLNIDVGISTTAGSVPGSNLFSTSFLTGGTGGDWAGATGLSWLLGPGTYWITFAGSTAGNAWMPWLPADSPNALPYAFAMSFDNFNWVRSSAPDSIAVRILGEALPDAPSVPDTSGTLTLAAAGFAGLVVLRRRLTQTRS